MNLTLCNLRRRFKVFVIYFISWKFLIFLGLVALSLQTVSIGLSWWIQVSPSKKNLETKEVSHSQKVSLSTSEILSYISQASVLDSSGEFKFVIAILSEFPIKLSDYFEKEKEPNSHAEIHHESHAVTLVSQCSLSLLYLVPELAKHWEGPLSIALFLLTEEIQIGVQMLLLLHKCFPSIHYNVTFNIVYPLSSTVPNAESALNDVPCSLVIPSLTKFKKNNYEFKNIAYPNNLLRNIARKAVKSSYMMVLDIDMLPNKNLHSMFSKYIKTSTLNSKKDQERSKEEKTVYIVPSYEVEENVDVPDFKSELLKLRKEGLARPFYQELCWKCQKYTEYDKWEKHTNPNSEFGVSLSPLYEVIWKDPWEPFYISKSNVPLYDERFRQYGFNRISQVCELHIAGYRFVVLDSAFVVHKGFKKAGQLHKKKDKELDQNRILFRGFKTYLKEKYPESTKRCY